MKKLFFTMIVAVILAGCTGTDNDIVTEKSLPDIYQAAYEQFNDENHEEAAQEFLKAETQHPSSPWAADALIMAAYSYYMDDDFAGAILAADRFMRFHPGHKDVPYVLYLRGMCYYRQVSDVRREPGMSAYALQQFQTLVQRFPHSTYAKNAENKIPRKTNSSKTPTLKQYKIKSRISQVLLRTIDILPLKYDINGKLTSAIAIHGRK
jgi:outer membrane protein assembly factor BamD